MKIFFIICLFLLFCKPSVNSKIEVPNPEKVKEEKWIVTPVSGLYLRESPLTTAKSIRLLPRGTMVNHKQIPENEKSHTIQEQKGKWLKVEVGNESGWIFDVYLSEPVFSPSGDKFYFVTVKDPESKKVVNGYCGSAYREMEYICLTEIRNARSFKIIDTISSDKGIWGWYNNENILSSYVLGDGGGVYYDVHTINIKTSVERNLYEKSSQNFLHTMGEVNKEYVGWDKTCIFEKCLELSRGVNEVYVLFYSKKLNEKVEDKEKTLINKFKISISQNFWIKYLSEEQILKLKYPYTGNIEFSVDKRNYLLHVPTGKISEVKEK